MLNKAQVRALDAPVQVSSSRQNVNGATPRFHGDERESLLDRETRWSEHDVSVICHRNRCWTFVISCGHGNLPGVSEKIRELC